MAVLWLSATGNLRGSFPAFAALALATAVVSRLFSILRLNPPASIAGLKPEDLDLLVATGPAVRALGLLGWFLGVFLLFNFVFGPPSVAVPSDSRKVTPIETSLP